MAYRVNVLGYDYLIIETEDSELMTDDGTIGMCCYTDQVIYLRRALSNQRKKEVLMHELAHAFMYEGGFNNADMDNETICNFVSKHACKIVELANRYMKEVEQC